MMMIDIFLSLGGIGNCIWISLLSLSTLSPLLWSCLADQAKPSKFLSASVPSAFSLSFFFFLFSFFLSVVVHFVGRLFRLSLWFLDFFFAHRVPMILSSLLTLTYPPVSFLSFPFFLSSLFLFLQHDRVASINGRFEKESAEKSL